LIIVGKDPLGFCCDVLFGFKYQMW
jgi:hypothetical protein